TPEYVPECATAPAADAAEHPGTDTVVCRTNYWRGGLCGVGRHRTYSGAECGSATLWDTASGTATNYRPWRVGALYCYRASGHISTDEHSLWFIAASRHAYPPKKGAARGADRPGAGGPASVARLGALMMDTYLAAFQTYLDVERQASPHTLRNYLSDLRQFVHFASVRLGQAAPLMPGQINTSLI